MHVWVGGATQRRIEGPHLLNVCAFDFLCVFPVQAKHKEAKLHIGKSTALTVADLLASIQCNSQVLINKPARSLLDVDFDEEAHEAAAVAVTEQARLVVLTDGTLRFSRRLESLPMYGEPAS